jgi:hypothetical protein
MELSITWGKKREEGMQAYLDLTVGITAPTIIRISTITYKGISISGKKHKTEV